MKILKEYSSALMNPKLASTGVKVAIVVGSVLFTINHGNAVVKGQMTRDRWLSGLLTYIVPYMVNIHGQFISKSKKLKIEDYLPEQKGQLNIAAFQKDSALHVNKQ
ncbi:hypothetical protein Xen7305DRAFT_00045850 [Xenococcus sp. PCC 7305]|uniref:nitrate/nitrite transporter NrtS n=1 Tax=Xenococcus sp. PCC 7305 TaxID=102125 RepID=UPI0002ACECEB|nr:nitrate/nitrite transporter NrtS [Xenococcus sp. PCC 7305]ELS04849.1 hypothetical protein Xen7305DRAFT_00045850 [Xenococcus sp. PCC 7305]